MRGRDGAQTTQASRSMAADAASSSSLKQLRLNRDAFPLLHGSRTSAAACVASFCCCGLPDPGIDSCRLSRRRAPSAAR